MDDEIGTKYTDIIACIFRDLYEETEAVSSLAVQCSMWFQAEQSSSVSFQVVKKFPWFDRKFKDVS